MYSLRTVLVESRWRGIVQFFSTEAVALKVLVAVASTVVLARFGVAATLVGVIIAPISADAIKEFVTRHRWRARRIWLVALLLILFDRTRAAFAAVRGRKPTNRAHDPRARGPASLSGGNPLGRLLATSLAAWLVTVGIFTAPELAIGKSLLTSRHTTFFGGQRTARTGDVVAPRLSLPHGITVHTLMSSAVVRYDASAVDSAEGRVAVRCMPPSGARFPEGTTSVRCVAADSAGNVARGSFVVTVEVVPVLLSLPAHVRVEAQGPFGARVRWHAAARADGGREASVKCTPASGSVFPLGTRIVSCTAAVGGESIRRTMRVTVADTRAPRMTAPSALHMKTTMHAGLVVSFLVTARDVVDGGVGADCSPASGSRFPLGRTVVHCAALDSQGNRVSRTFPVDVLYVTDEVTPILSIPADQRVEATQRSGTRVTYAASARDGIDGLVPDSCSPVSGSLFPIGRTVVTCTAKDESGNERTRRFSISVVDTTAPRLKVPWSIVVSTWNKDGMTVSFKTGAFDTVDGIVGLDCDPPSGSLFPHGKTVVTCTASDRRRNTASASFNVIVDYPPPIP
jgi:HYR domain